ncbi:MAG: hypothetical protein KAS63_07905 [Candidatus Heimdallarchaeota archaeon]|nr:hypothetical protein [Candidatus Heimdallarchaeota archaeon]MCK4955273.1 hypothetical protein [Candidatus Heimdallarchaeota archaeon]
MKVGFLQFKPVFCDAEENISILSKMIDQSESFDLLVIPELANSGYVFVEKNELEQVAEEIPSGFFVEKLEEIAKQRDGFIVSGICEKKGNKFFNSSVLIGPDGYISTYRKIHLFDREKLFFEPGNGPFKVFDVKGMKIGMLICFDWVFPEATRILAIMGIDLLAHSANLVLSYCQTAMLTRSVENQIFTITANRVGTETNGDVSLDFTGLSQITSPSVQRLAEADKKEEVIKIVEIDLEESRDKWLSERNNIFDDRRTDLYTRLLDIQ